MTTFDTSGSREVITHQTDTGSRREIKVWSPPPHEVVTGAQYTAGSVPSGLPEVADQVSGYVFRVGSGTPLERVTIKLDTDQLTEQARMRKVNQAIERARR